MIKFTPRIQNFVIRCNKKKCGHQSEFYGTLAECMALAKSEGWEINPNSISKDAHVCPDCILFDKNNAA